ncbi:MAG: tryptophan-rich sensory protein [Methanoregula sp.]|nr:tryptophan-rich sensory protein [Methanoregula sp.]
MDGKKVLLFVIALGICLLAGYIGSYYTTPEIPTWYADLQKPELNPPSWVFAPVWTVLYILMGISLYWILSTGLKSQDSKLGLILFIFQLVLNVTWSFLFFGLHSTFFSFLIIVMLWAVLLCAIVQIFRFSIPAAVLLIPYLCWISFAAYLNYAILILNPMYFGISV